MKAITSLTSAECDRGGSETTLQKLTTVTGWVCFDTVEWCEKWVWRLTHQSLYSVTIHLTAIWHN